jgi:uncharacterized phage protein (TIGR01671 family)
MDIFRLRFRYWDKEIKKMYDVAKLDFWGTDEGWTVDLCDSMGKEQLFDVDDIDTDNLMQSTGFKDHKLNDIYEGDIVSFVDITDTESGYSEYNCIGVVQWDSDTASFNVTNRLSAESYEVLDGECTVIGNIYENPDLI